MTSIYGTALRGPVVDAMVTVNWSRGPAGQSREAARDRVAHGGGGGYWNAL